MSDVGKDVYNDAQSKQEGGVLELDDVQLSLARARARDQMLVPLLDRIQKGYADHQVIRRVLDVGKILGAHRPHPLMTGEQPGRERSPRRHQRARSNMLGEMLNVSRARARPIPQLEAFKALFDLVWHLVPGSDLDAKRRQSFSADTTGLTLAAISSRISRISNFPTDWDLDSYLNDHRRTIVASRKGRHAKNTLANLHEISQPVGIDAIKAAHRMAHLHVATVLAKPGGSTTGMFRDLRRPSERFGVELDEVTAAELYTALEAFPKEAELAKKALESRVERDREGNISIEKKRDKKDLELEQRAAKAIVATAEAVKALGKAEKKKEEAKDEKSNNWGSALMWAGAGLFATRVLQTLDLKLELSSLLNIFEPQNLPVLLGMALTTTGGWLRYGKNAITAIKSPATVRGKERRLRKAKDGEREAIEKYYAAGMTGSDTRRGRHRYRPTRT